MGLRVGKLQKWQRQNSAFKASRDRAHDPKSIMIHDPQKVVGATYEGLSLSEAQLGEALKALEEVRG